MANRRISEFPEINGLAVDGQDLLTLVHVFEVDPVLKNKKITCSGFRDYLDQYYTTLTGNTFAGNITVTGNLTVNGNASFQSGTFQSLTVLTQVYPGNAIISGNFTVLSGLFVSGQTVLNDTITGTTAQFATVTGTTAQFATVTGTTAQFATVTGNTGNFKNITGETLHITAPSGGTSAIVCSGVVSGGASGFVIKGPLIILP